MSLGKEPISEADQQQLPALRNLTKEQPAPQALPASLPESVEPSVNNDIVINQSIEKVEIEPSLTQDSFNKEDNTAVAEDCNEDKNKDIVKENQAMVVEDKVGSIESIPVPAI